ncbi:MAG: glycerol kinase GlpK [Actinomycetales bacterium]|nr:glycerol kinase GlpK [Actinomycetales bacterium]
MSFIGALDQGTSSTRFMIFNEEGAVIGQHQLEHKQILPRPGWVEHDAWEIWERSVEVISESLRKTGISGKDLAGIGITNQRETTVIWDKQTGKPLHNAIVWQDTRTQEFLDNFSDSEKALIVRKTGLAIAPYFSGSKLNWLLNNVPDVKRAIDSGNALAGTIDSWLLWKLSGGTHKTDVTNASRTLLMDLETLDWDRDLLRIFGIPREILPTICSSSEVFASSLDNGPVGAAVPISGILGDQQAAMVGQVCFEKGDSKTTYGTGNFALLNTGEELVRSKHGLLTTVCFKFGSEPARYALEGSVAVTGSAVQWLRDQLGLIKQASEIESLAAAVKDNGGVYFVPAFSGLFAPYWRSDARGVIVGLTRAANKSHIARATLEAISFQTKEILDAMAQDSGVKLTEMRVDGGITANELCMQIQSDVMQIDVVRPKVIETTALGAAYAAGLSVGYFKDKAQLRTKWQEARRWKPTQNTTIATDGFKNWQNAIERSLNWIDLKK